MREMMDALNVFESDAGSKLDSLSLWNKPLVGILSHFFLAIDQCYAGARFTRDRRPEPEKGDTIIRRISYLCKYFHLAGTSDSDNIDDAIKRVADDREDIITALLYAHLCEIMPEYRNGYYVVDVEGSRINLRHPSSEFADSERKDIILSELSLAFQTKRPPFPREDLVRLIQTWPNIDWTIFRKIVKTSYYHHIETLYEQPMVPDTVFEQGFGFSRPDFRKVRAALADWCLGMSFAAEREHNQAPSPLKPYWFSQTLGWSCPSIADRFIINVVNDITDCSHEIILKIIDPFRMDANSSNFGAAGDGFLPPLTQIGNKVIFSPYALKNMFAERNIPYVLNKRDRSHFDDFVSAYFEPSLLDDAIKIIRRLQGVRVERNFVWEKGEIDILAFQPSTNVALQIQAKAALPPQGARMTRQVEQHTIKAVAQLQTLIDEPTAVKDELCKRAFNIQASSVHWVSVVLSRSSFGTHRAWQKLTKMDAMNIALLNETIRRLMSSRRPNLKNIPACVSDIYGEITNSDNGGWENDSFSLLGRDLNFPILRLKDAKIQKMRRGMLL